ncbi:hypothetical protein DFJ73DRAFT_627807, partial [Zopfochytrium polystomum]
MAPKSLVCLTAQQKIEICKQQEENPTLSQTKLAAWAKQRFNLEKAPAQATISNILLKRKEFEGELPDLKRKRHAHQPQLELAVANWVLQCRHQRIPVTYDSVKEKGRQFAERLNLHDDDAPDFSSGWVDRFSKRH